MVVFDTGDEAIAMANDTEHGMIAQGYAGDLAHRLRFTGILETGTVGLGSGLVSDHSAPSGSGEQSGNRRAGDHEGMLDHLEQKYDATDW